MFFYRIFSHHVYTITQVFRFVKYYFWSDGVESNHHKWFCRPSPHHSATITDIFLADHRGIEPLLLDLESNVLPLTLMACGRDDRARTCDLMLPKHVRYQLRYIPIERGALRSQYCYFFRGEFFPNQVLRVT